MRAIDHYKRAAAHLAEVDGMLDDIYLTLGNTEGRDGGSLREYVRIVSGHAEAHLRAAVVARLLAGSDDPAAEEL